MSVKLDLTLPAIVPSLRQYRDEPMQLLPAALYTLIELADVELEACQQLCERESKVDIPGSNVQLAPRTQFVGEPLQTVVSYHLQLGEQRTFDRTLFIVVVSRDWRNSGVLLVTLCDDDLEYRTDKFLVRPDNSGPIIIDLQLGNSDWVESKECYSIDKQPIEGHPEGGDDDDDNDNDNNGGDKSTSPDSVPSLPDCPGSPEHGPIPPKHRNPLGYYIGVYAVSGIDRENLIRTLEPGASVKKPEAYNCRLQAVFPTSSTDSVSEAINIHPARCRVNPWLHKWLFLVADTIHPDDDGIVLVSLGGHAKNKEFPVNASQRVVFDAKIAVQDAICTMAMGLRGWLRPTGPAVGVFAYNNGNQELYVPASVLDPKTNSRPTGEELLVFAPQMEKVKGKGLRRIEYSLGEAVRRWPQFCARERFRYDFCRDIFICIDNSDVGRNGVLLVKVEWDAATDEASSEKTKPMILADGIETWKVEAKTAHQTLKEVVDGKLAWEGRATSL